MFTNENYPDKPQDTNFKRAIVSFIKALKESKDDKKKLFNDLKKNKDLGDGQENKIKLMEMIKTVQDSKMECNKEIETLKRTQAKIKMELEKPIIPLENSKEKPYK